MSKENDASGFGRALKVAFEHDSTGGNPDFTRSLPYCVWCGIGHFFTLLRRLRPVLPFGKGRQAPAVYKSWIACRPAEFQGRGDSRWRRKISPGHRAFSGGPKDRRAISN